MSEYSEIHKKRKTSKNYNFRFDSPTLSVMNELERRIIKELSSEFKPNNVLDLACGTGRVTKWLLEFNSCKISGWDNSQQMMDESHLIGSRVELKLVDLKDIKQDLLKERFDFVTCFRFFANAERDLKLITFAILSEIVQRDGVVILNNHKNRTSSGAFASRIRNSFKNSWQSNKELKDMWRTFGFDCIQSYSLGVTPQDERKFFALENISKRIELWNFHVSGFHRFGINQIYVLQRRAK